MTTYVFNSLKRNNSTEISCALNNLYFTDKPVIICVGSDLVIGDSLGPIIGSYLVKNINGNAYVYGTLSNPITAKEITVIKSNFSKIHPFSQILVIDAAIGQAEEVGFVKISKGSIKPGLGANKDLPMIGDVSIIGVVNDKTSNLYDNSTRLSLVYTLALDIANGILKRFK